MWTTIYQKLKVMNLQPFQEISEGTLSILHTLFPVLQEEVKLTHYSNNEFINPVLNLSILCCHYCRGIHYGMPVCHRNLKKALEKSKMSTAVSQ